MKSPKTIPYHTVITLRPFSGSSLITRVFAKCLNVIQNITKPKHQFYYPGEAKVFKDAFESKKYRFFDLNPPL